MSYSFLHSLNCVSNNTEPSVTKGLSNLLDPFDFISLIIFIITAAAAVPAPGREKRGTMNKKKYAKYTDDEIAQIKKWRGEGLTWAEISDKNGRSPKSMSLKFSKMTIGVPKYEEPVVPKVVVPDNVKSINEKKAVTVKRRIPQKYTVLIDVRINYETLEDASKLVKEFNKLIEITQGYSGRVKLFEENEIEI